MLTFENSTVEPVTLYLGLAPIRIEQLPGDYLTAVRWKLAGRWLVPLPLSAAP